MIVFIKWLTNHLCYRFIKRELVDIYKAFFLTETLFESESLILVSCEKCPPVPV